MLWEERDSVRGCEVINKTERRRGCWGKGKREGERGRERERKGACGYNENKGIVRRLRRDKQNRSEKWMVIPSYYCHGGYRLVTQCFFITANETAQGQETRKRQQQGSLIAARTNI